MADSDTPTAGGTPKEDVAVGGARPHADFKSPASLDALWELIDGLPDPLRALCAEIDPAALERVLVANGPAIETLLQDLSAPSPRRPNRATAHHLRRRLGALNDRRRQHAVHLMCRPVLEAMRLSEPTEVVAAWGSELCRLALVAAIMCRHQRGAPPFALRELLSQDLLPEVWAPHRVALAAAASEAFAPYESPSAGENHDPGAHDYAKGESWERFTAAEGLADEVASLELSALGPWAAVQVDAFRRSLADTANAAGRVAADAEAGRVPSADDVRSQQEGIAVSSMAGRRLRAVLQRIHHGESPTSGDSPDTPVHEVKDLATVEHLMAAVQVALDPAAGAVRRLTAVSGPDGAEALLAAVASAAGDPAHRDFSLALVELIDSVASGADPLRVAELDAAARRKAPAEMTAAVVLASTGNLHVPAGPGAVAVPAGPAGTGQDGIEAPPEENTTDLPEQVPVEKASADEPPADVAPPTMAASHERELVEPPTAVQPQSENGPAVAGASLKVESLTGLAPELLDKPIPAPATDASGAMMERTARPSSTPRAPKPPSVMPAEIDEPSTASAAEEERIQACEDLMLTALDQRRFALAWWASVASGEPAPLLRLVSLATAVRTSTGPAADELREQALGLTRAGYGLFSGIQVLAAVASVRASLVAPSAATSQVASDLARMLGLPGLSRLAEAAVMAANRGVALDGDTLSGLVDADRLETRIRNRVEAVTSLGKERRFSFQRASEIWRTWTAADGMLGEVLAPVAADDRSRAEEVTSAAEALRAREVLERALRDADNRLRHGGSKRIEGSARNNLLDGAASLVDGVLAWCADVVALSRLTRDAGWLDAPTAALRTAATGLEADVRNELRGAATDPFSEAAANAAGEVLDDIYRLLAGQPPAPGPERPEAILGHDLLLGDTRVGPGLMPVGQLDPAELGPALSRDLPDAFAARARRGDHLASGLIVEAVAAIDPGLAATLAARRTEQVATWRGTTADAVAAARTQLDQARRQLHVSEDRYAELSARLEGAAREGREDFDAVAAELNAVATEASGDRSRAVAAFLADLEDAAADSPGVAAVRNRVAALAATDLATAAEWRSLAADGQSLTETTEAEFSVREIWPRVVEQVGAAISDELIEALAARKDVGVLAFSKLPADAAERAATALRRWRRLAKGHRPRDWADELRPVLRLLGLDAAGVDTTRSLPSSAQRQWVELNGVDRQGSKALVPAFGSKIDNRLRVLVVAGAPTDAKLLEWATPQNEHRPVLVLHLGSLTEDFRSRFALACRERRARPEVAVVDDAVLAWAAARGEFRFETLMRAILPFVGTNPYLPPSGDCPPELFYGRSGDRRALVDTQGSCLLYGGRQLGKSALLRSTVRDFVVTPGQAGCYIDLKPASIASTRRADVVWEMLWSRLGEQGVVSAGRGAGRDPAAKVAEAVRRWLADDTGRRILVALDECDEFFDVDAATNFATTSRLKDLMDVTGRRFKVVWAGLHQVARFANVPNQPLAHLGRPIGIGPLDPSAAHRLIAEPMRALGIRFASPDLVNRVLAYCNYQPVLLHLFGQALVEQMVFPPRGPMPVTVSATDVETVASSPGLQHEIRERFELTLGLDPRYRVIAYTVAYEAHTRGMEMALSASELRAACERWWPAGFARLDAAEFRALLEEMASLGVLAASTGRTGWRLRSPNVLRMLGTVGHVEDRLLEEESREPTWLVATEARRVLADGRRSPVTEGQLTDLVGEGRNQVRVVIGSEATCVGALADALNSVAEATGRFKARRPNTFDGFRRNLAEGTVGEHFVVVSDLRGVSADGFAKSLAAATSRVPARGGTRSVLLVADASNFDAVADLVDPGGEALAGVEVTPLRRLDLRGLGAWALEVESAFQSDEARRRLAEITGGWPVLLEEAGALARTSRGTTAIISELDSRLASADGKAALIDAVGLGSEGPLASLVNFLASSPDASLSVEDLAEFVEGCERPASVVAMLRALGVLDAAPATEGELRLEPVLAQCWLDGGGPAPNSGLSDSGVGGKDATA